MTLPELVPYLILPLSSIGFILAFVADKLSDEARMKVAFICLILATVCVLAMKQFT